MACMAAGLLDHVHQRPPQRPGALAGRTGVGRAVEVGASGDVLVRSVDGIAVGGQDAFGGLVSSGVKGRRPVRYVLT